MHRPEMSAFLARPKAQLARRLKLVRSELYGDRTAELASRLGLPERTWANYEAGVTIPGEVLLRFLAITQAEPVWMLHGDGPRFRTE